MSYKFNPFTGTFDDVGNGGGPTAAVDVSYDNTSSGLPATNVQDAIDELAGSIVTPTQTKVEHITLNSTDITNQYVELQETPLNALEVALDVIGGGPQFPGDDFQIVGSQLQFIGNLANLGESALVDGDKIRIIYVY